MRDLFALIQASLAELVDDTPDVYAPAVMRTSNRSQKRTVQIAHSAGICPQRDAFFKELAAKRAAQQLAKQVEHAA